MTVIWRAWHAWVAVTRETEDARPLAAVRVLVAATVLGTLLLAQQDAGLALLTAAEHGGIAPDGRGPAWFVALGGATPLGVRALLAAGGGLAALLLVGWGGRLVPLLLGQVCLAVFALHPGTGGGHDRVITNALWLLTLAPSTATWSIDAWRRHGRLAPDVQVGAWGRRLVLFQLVVLYTLTGLEKQGAAWTAAGGYRAVYDSLLLPTWARFDLSGALAEAAWFVGPGLAFATWLTWWWEVGWAGLGLWLLARWWRDRSGVARRPGRRFDLRAPFIAVGLLVHGTLWMLLNLGPFSPITLALYPALFKGDRASWVRGWLREPARGLHHA